MRVILSLILSALLALTSVGFASARVQEIGMADMVICSNGAAMAITLDATGLPVDRPHHCPDCLSALPPPVLPLQVVQLGLRLARVDIAAFNSLSVPLLFVGSPSARGPPLAV